MARLFDDSSTEYLYIDSIPVSSYPFAFVCIFNVDDKTANNTLMAYHGATDNYIRLQARTPTGYLYANKYDTSGYANAQSAIEYTQDIWHHGTGIYVAANDTRVLLDGGNKGTNSTSSTPTVTKTKVGWEGQGALYMSGHIAVAAIYDLSVWPGATDSDKADNFEKAMSGVGGILGSPLLEPLGLKVHWDLIRGLTDIDVSGLTLTASGPTISPHPNIVY